MRKIPKDKYGRYKDVIVYSVERLVKSGINFHSALKMMRVSRFCYDKYRLKYTNIEQQEYHRYGHDNT
jgi:hypothetical protein